MILGHAIGKQIKKLAESNPDRAEEYRRIYERTRHLPNANRLLLLELKDINR